jgi:hypothetical protein
MNRLNGWQRIWVVLMVLWTWYVMVIGYDGRPDDVPHYINNSEDPPYAKMAPEVRERMTLTPKWEGEDCDGTSPLDNLLEEVRDLPGLSVPVRLCFAARLPDDERQKIDELVGRMKAGGESEEDIKGVVDELARRARKKGSLLTLQMPIEVNAIKAEYARAYRVELDELRQQHYQEMALQWLVPGAVLYAFGWSVGWTRRGFKKSSAP